MAIHSHLVQYDSKMLVGSRTYLRHALPIVRAKLSVQQKYKRALLRVAPVFVSPEVANEMKLDFSASQSSERTGYREGSKTE